MWKEVVRKVSRSRLLKAGKAMNVCTENNINLRRAYSQASSHKRYYTDFTETIDMVAQLLEKCFGASKAEFSKQTTKNELAQVKMRPADVVWQQMLNKRDELQGWISQRVTAGDLWTPPEGKELQQLEELDILQLTAPEEPEEELEQDSDAEDESEDSDDDNVPLASLRTATKSAQVKHWLESSKPLPQENADEYAERIMMIVGRGEADQRRLRSQRSKKASDKVDYEAGAAARRYFTELKGRPAEGKPTKIVSHKAAGPRRGTVYEVEWRTPGYGPAKKAWKTLDYVLQYNDIFENYKKVLATAPVLHTACLCQIPAQFESSNTASPCTTCHATFVLTACCAVAGTAYR